MLGCRDIRLGHQRAYLAGGVTTVLDTGITAADAREGDAWLAAGNPRPRVLMLMPALTTPQGFASEQVIEDRFSEIRDLPVVGVKVFMESGFGPVPTLPGHDLAIRQSIVAAAALRDLPIYVHALVHAGVTDEPPSARSIRRLADFGTYVMSTIAIEDTLLIGFNPERPDDPLLRLTVPPIELQTAADPRSQRELAPSLHVDHASAMDPGSPPKFG